MAVYDDNRRKGKSGDVGGEEELDAEASLNPDLANDLDFGGDDDYRDEDLAD